MERKPQTAMRGGKLTSETIELGLAGVWQQEDRYRCVCHSCNHGA